MGFENAKTQLLGADTLAIPDPKSTANREKVPNRYTVTLEAPRSTEKYHYTLTPENSIANLLNL